MSAADGLLLTCGEDISIEFHTETPTEASLIQETNPRRDGWEFEAVNVALKKQMPILAIGRGMEVLNIAMGGTLHLHIDGHQHLPNDNSQPLRYARNATFHFPQVNSAHHQAVKDLADGFIVEAWCQADDIIEQIRLQKYPYALGVQYHPQKHEVYRPVFDSFIEAVRLYKQKRAQAPAKTGSKKRAKNKDE
jgi:putative glutamine amidotransferase